MFKLYNDTEKELFENDYKPLPQLDNLTCTQLVELTENLYAAFENYSLYGNDFIATALYDDIVKVNKKRLFEYLLTTSPGHIGSVINSTKYNDIDKAIHIVWQYANACEEEEFFNLEVGNEQIENLIKEVYTGERKLDD